MSVFYREIQAMGCRMSWWEDYQEGQKEGPCKKFRLRFELWLIKRWKCVVLWDIIEAFILKVSDEAVISQTFQAWVNGDDVALLLRQGSWEAELVRISEFDFGQVDFEVKNRYLFWWGEEKRMSSHTYCLLLLFILYLFRITAIVALILWVLTMNLGENMRLATGQKDRFKA